MVIFKIKDVDDLELIQCSCVRLYSKVGGKLTANPHCIACKGTGELVIHKTKYFERRRLDRREKRQLVSK